MCHQELWNAQSLVIPSHPELYDLSLPETHLLKVFRSQFETVILKAKDLVAEDRSSVVDTNLNKTLYICQTSGEAMLRRGNWRIINSASLFTFVGLLEAAAYGASKAAPGSLTRLLGVEWSKQGV
ncbi:MAG TPA: SDR family NAD(P)-dependent oxidoreductase [Terracidiphilus sp.]